MSTWQYDPTSYDVARACVFERLVEATAPPNDSARCSCDRCEDARRRIRSVA